MQAAQISKTRNMKGANRVVPGMFLSILATRMVILAF